MKININKLDELLETDLPLQQKIVKTRDRVNSTPMESDSEKNDSYTKTKQKKNRRK
jgi:hypothetical protein